MSFDVSMRLNLEYKDQDARRAKKDLKDLIKAAHGLRGAGADKLEKNLEGVSRNARQAATALERPAESITRLNTLKTDRVERELNELRAAAAEVGSKLDFSTDKLRVLNSGKTDRAEEELKDLKDAADKLRGGLDGSAAELRELNEVRTDRAEAELKSLKDAATELSTKLDLPAEKLDTLGQSKTDKAEAELDALKQAATDLTAKLQAPIDAFKDLNAVTTDQAEAELKALAERADALEEKLDKLQTGSNGGKKGRPNSSGGGTPNDTGRNSEENRKRAGAEFYDRMPLGAAVPITNGGAVAAGAGVAAGVIASAHAFKRFASADRRMSWLGMSVGAGEAETAAANKHVRALATDLGVPNEHAVSGLEDIIASGVENLSIGLEMLPATLKASIGSGTPSTLMATALKATMDQMALSPAQLMQASDTIITGGRMGKFEVEDMAQYLPTLLPIAASQLKYSGVEGLQKVAADLQVVREASGSSGEAFTRVKDFYLKIFQEATQKNFKDVGLDLEGTIQKATANGQDPITAAIALTQQAVAKNPSILPKLFTDQESLLAAQAFLARPNGRADYINGMRRAQGSTEDSYLRVSRDAQASIDRLGNAGDNMAVGIGGLLDKIGLPALLNAIGGASVQISDRGLMAFPEAMQRVYNRYWTQPATDWVNRQLGIESTNKTPPAALGGASDPVDALRGYLERSKSIEQPSLSTWPQMGRSNRKISSSDEPLEELLRDLPTYVPTWMDKKRIKIDPEIEPDLGKVSSKLEPAGAEAGAKFAAALKSEAERVGAVADELKARFSFTATPTISPSYSAVPSSASGPVPASTRRSSAQASRPVVNQKIYGKTDPRRTARAVIREENRAVRRTMARALHDRGPLA